MGLLCVWVLWLRADMGTVIAAQSSASSINREGGCADILLSRRTTIVLA